MNEPLLFTPQDVINAILAVCGAISVVAGAVAVIVKIIVSAKRPNKLQDEKIAALEGKIAKLEERFANDKTRLDAIDEANAVTQTAILALLSHAINGNDTEALKRAKSDLETYLTHNKGRAHRSGKE